MRTIRVTSFLVLALLAAPAALLPHLVLPAAADGKEGPKIPDGMKGFSGMLEGKVVRTEELGFLLKVSAVVKEWKKNRAKDSKSAVGKELLVNAQWEKGDGGNWRPVSAHVAFFRTLKPGQELRIEVVNDEGERLHILELSKDQRAEAAKQDAKRAGGRDGDAKAENDREDAARENRGTDEPKEGDRPESDRDDGSLEKEPAGQDEQKEGERAEADRDEGAHGRPEPDGDQAHDGKSGLPDGLRGFSGMLSGTVVRKAEHGFVLKAGAPKAAAGHELLINVQWEKGEGDNWRPVPVHVRFVEGLKPGDETKIEVVNDEGDRLHILELP